MGGSSIGYLLREGARNIYANKQMSVAAIGVLVACMLLIGASIVFSFNANSFVGYVEAQNEVVVFLKDNLSDDSISEVEQQLKNTENVSAVRFISKEEGLDSWVQSMSGVAENSEELFAPLYEDNIMPDSFSVTIRDLSQLDATVQVLSDYDDVDYVRAPEQVAQTITIIKHAVNLGGAAIVLLLIGVLYVLLHLGILNTLTGVIVVAIALRLPGSTFIIRNFFAGIPQDIENSALVDGCNRLTAFFQVIIHMVKPGLASISIFAFMSAWSNYLLFNVLIFNTKTPVLATYLRVLSRNDQMIADYGVFAAMAMVYMLPVLIFFFISQRQLMQGTISGGKGI